MEWKNNKKDDSHLVIWELTNLNLNANEIHFKWKWNLLIRKRKLNAKLCNELYDKNGYKWSEKLDKVVARLPIVLKM